MTTYEHMRRLPRVFGGSCAQNWHDLCCLPTPDPFTDFHEAVEQAEQDDPPELIRRWNPPWCDTMEAAEPDPYPR